MVEVGVELKQDHKEYEHYEVKVNGVKRSLYDENVIAFLQEDKAFDFINEYVEEGVEGTYGVLWEIEREIEDYEMEELVNINYLEDEYLPREIDNVVFKGGLPTYA
jgi:hypothetical protein